MGPEPGISRALAQDRASRVSDVRYALRLTIPEERTAPVWCDVRIGFTLGDASGALVVDYAPDAAGRLHAAAANGVALDVSAAGGYLPLPNSALRRGPNHLHFTCVAGDGPLNRRDDYLYSLFVPARAHEAFPCFDQPDLKARWTLTLDLPPAWRAVANAPESATAATAASGTGRTVIEFQETEPLPTYLFAFAAGRLTIEQIQRAGRTFRVYHCGADPELLRLNLDAIVDAHSDALRCMEDYTAIAYPFEKFDVVLLPAFQFGGMEHPGALFYNAQHLLLASSATGQQLLARANVIAHETAHLWFGDLVTMTWFDDVWMKEVFANFLAAKMTNAQFGDRDDALRFLHAHYPGAYEVDRTGGANPVRQPLDTLADAGSLYGAIVYLKSPVVMRQLELLLGDTPLRTVLREYLETYRFGNASWSDLLRLIQRAPAARQVDLGRWSREWLEEAGRPVVHADLVVADDRVASLSLRVNDPVPGGRRTWPQRLDVALGYGPRVDHLVTWLDGACDFPQLTGAPAPDYVLPNGGGLGYGEFHLDDRSRAWLLAHITEVPDALTRGSAWLVLWDAMLCGEVVPRVLLDVTARSIARETSELNLQRQLLYIERLFWVFVTDDERRSAAAGLERMLRGELAVREPASLKAALFACIRAIATTEEATAWLRALWSGDARIEGLPLSESDMIPLAQELAVRGTAGSPDAILAEQLARTGNDDRRRWLAFVAPALSGDPSRRDQFFASLSDPANRRREPWVIDSLRWLHHPLRAAAAVEYLAPGLELLQEIKRTGDIFLPKRWADATLAGHHSPEAAAIVRTFLERRPASFPSALRRIVLASADYLFRAAAMRGHA